MRIIYSFCHCIFAAITASFTSSSVPCAISANISSEYGAYNGLYVFTDFNLHLYINAFHTSSPSKYMYTTIIHLVKGLAYAIVS